MENVPSGLLTATDDVGPVMTICAFPRGFPAPSVTVPEMLPTDWASTGIGVTNDVAENAIVSNVKVKTHRSFKNDLLLKDEGVSNAEAIEPPFDDPSFACVPQRGAKHGHSFHGNGSV